MKTATTLKPVKALRPAYLNGFRNTPQYQRALTHGVKVDGEVTRVEISDIVNATDIMTHVFPPSTKSNGIKPYVVKVDGKTYNVNFLNGLFRSPTMRVVGAIDKAALVRATKPDAYSDPFSQEVIFAYAACLERLHAFDRTRAHTQNSETRAAREWCTDTLEDFMYSADGLNAEKLKQVFRGEGNPRIKSAKTAKAFFENVVKYIIGQRDTLNAKLGEYRAKEFGEE